MLRWLNFHISNFYSRAGVLPVGAPPTRFLIGDLNDSLRDSVATLHPPVHAHALRPLHPLHPLRPLRPLCALSLTSTCVHYCLPS